jgi:TRAP-type C4-dicarboxylate transport system permease small subunit
VVIGGVPLLAAMFTEFLAVVARNTGWNIVGSIEFVQAMVLLSSCGAIVLATLSRSHAKVTVISRRITGRSGSALRLVIALGASTFFLALAAGSAWIAMDMWGAAEQSELLAIPYLPLRCVAALATFVVAVIYARRVIAELTGR